MKTILILITLMMMVSCGEQQKDKDQASTYDGIPAVVDSNSDGIADTLDNVTYYDDLISRPNCDEEHNQSIVFINEENAFYKCDAKDWALVKFVAKKKGE